MERRLFIGDIHGCSRELEELVALFRFNKKSDRLFSVGDILGRGPDAIGSLKFLDKTNAIIVRGNHDEETLQIAAKSESLLKAWERDYLACLGSKRDYWLKAMETWPRYFELDDIILVHAGLEPGVDLLQNMTPNILLNIRTWDGQGLNLKKEENPPWFHCVSTQKMVIFGHWAKMGLIDLHKFKGLDTGCVYGGKLTGFCPEERRFYSIQSKKAYCPINGSKHIIRTIH